MSYEHTPVLLREIVEMLDVKENGTYVDATVGLGGHAAEVLSKITDGRLIGIDRDDEALQRAGQRLGNHRVYLRKGSFSDIKDILLEMNIKEVDGVLFDLGASMLQLKEMERGFSFMSNARLDMRMDASQSLTAWHVTNKYPEKELERILREYGEEPFAGRIAKAIAMHRGKADIDTCAELAEIVMRVYRKRGRIHPATRTFQALRIEVNKEMDELKNGLRAALDIMKHGARLCVVSYHSIEDRIVKNFIKEGSKNDKLKMLTKKPIIPSSDEMRRNPSSRSAKLRAAEKI